MMTTDQKRRFFQRIKSLSTEKFFNVMDNVHSEAYYLAAKHYEEAMGIVLTPKQAAAVKEKATQIRSEWDNITEVKMDDPQVEA